MATRWAVRLTVVGPSWEQERTPEGTVRFARPLREHTVGTHGSRGEAETAAAGFRHVVGAAAVAIWVEEAP